MKTYNFPVTKRQVTGKSVASLRAEDLIPGVVYGPELPESLNIQMREAEAHKLFKQAGESSIVFLEVEGEKEPLETLIKDVAYDPVTMKLEHIDFYKIKAGQKLEAAIPLRFVGESPAVKVGGTFVSSFDEINVRCLPKDLMDEIVVDISVLKTPEDTIFVKDLNISANIEVMEHAEDAVASVKVISQAEFEVAAPVVAAEPELAGKDKKAGDKDEVKGDVKAAAPAKK